MSTQDHPCLSCQHPLPIEVVSCPHCGFALGNGEAPEAWMGEEIDSKYEVEELLGAGGMGMVFRARRALLGDEVALKILFPHFLKSDLQRRLFTDEAISTAQVNHPNVITIYDADVDERYKVAYMVMELLEGQSFKELMISEAPMAPSMIYPIFTQVCAGLHAAHHMNIIHRDLKPDNIFLSANDEGELIAKVLDFGIATVRGHVNEDEQNKLLGTLRYMAPEQCRGEPTSPATDLYALGVILYESITRQRATGKTVEAVLSELPRPLNERLPADKSVPLELEALVMELLSKDPQARPQSALEVMRRLKHLQDPFASLDEPTPSQPFGAAPFSARSGVAALGAHSPPSQPDGRPTEDFALGEATGASASLSDQKARIKAIIVVITLCALVFTLSYLIFGGTQ